MASQQEMLDATVAFKTQFVPFLVSAHSAHLLGRMSLSEVATVLLVWMPAS
jgi:hypothetical protein